MRSFSVFALTAALAVGCADSGSKTTTADADALPAGSGSAEAKSAALVVFNADGAPTVAFDVPGIHCEFCAASVKEALVAHPGVVDVKVDVEEKVAEVAIDEESFDSGAAIEALAAANFPDVERRDTPQLVAPLAEKPSDEPALEVEATEQPTG